MGITRADSGIVGSAGTTCRSSFFSSFHTRRGAGVRLGLAFLQPTSAFGYPGSAKWLGLPVDGLRDVLRIYAMIVPLFLVASLVEFLAG
jgi:hypothetical protein